MDHQKNYSVNQEMEDMAVSFLNNQKEISSGRMAEEDLAKLSTQAWWESEQLSLKKQQNMGLMVEMSLEPYQKMRSKGNNTHEDRYHPEGIVTARAEGNAMTGTSRRDVLAYRNVFQNGNKIFQSKSKCIATVNLLKSNVNGEEVTCPNCGAYGTVSSFINGCDYCHTKFKVEDFNAKVSGFSLIEDVAQRLSEFKNRMFKTYIIMFLAIFCILFFGGIASTLLVSKSTRFQVGFLNSYISAGMIAIKVLAAFFMTVFSTAVIEGLYRKPTSTFSNQNIVTQIYPAFSPADFLQNIEYRLKAVMMATSMKQIEAFCDCDMTSFIDSHRNVFDMNVSRMVFRNAQIVNQGRGCQVTVDVSVKLYLLNNNRINMRYETISLVVYEDQSAISQNISVLRSFKCQNCNSNVNIFNGGICEYCNTQLNKYSLGWVIEGYYGKQERDMYRMMPLIICGLFLLFLLLPIF